MIGAEGSGIKVFAVRFEGWQRFFDHVDIIGSQDCVEDGKNRRRVERQVAGGLLDHGGKDLKGDLNIAVNCVSTSNSQSRWDAYPSLRIYTSLAVFFSRKAPTF